MGNIYQKLAQARVELQNKGLKKSGENKFSGFTYFELSDFLPSINDIFNQIGLCGIVSFTQELATLTIHNTENDEKLVITSPMEQATVKGCQPIQNLGAIQTYQRRYLYLSALEIVENDRLDKEVGNPAQITQEKSQKPQSKEAVLQKFIATLNSTTNIEAVNEQWVKSESYFDKRHPEIKERAYAAYINRYTALGGQ